MRAVRERIVSRRRALIGAIAVITSIILTTCASGSSTTSPPAVGEAFAARAVSVCEQAVQAKQAWSPFPVQNFDPAAPDASALPQVAVWLQEQVAPTWRTWLQGLKSLGEPPTGRQAWDAVLVAVAKIIQFDNDQIAAAKTSDTAAFAVATNGGRATNPKLQQATAAAGVPTCAEVHS